MAAVPQRHMGGSGEPSIFQKMKMGAMMGAGVGLTIGFIFGGFTILRGGAGPKGALSTLSQYMLSSAATFSFFLSVGSVIRQDALISPHLEAAHMQMLAASPLVRSRQDGAILMRARWEAEKQRRAVAV